MESSFLIILKYVEVLWAMRKVIGVLADLSTYYWVLTAVGLPVVGPTMWGALISFLLYTVLKLANAVKVPIASLALGRVSERVTDVVDCGSRVFLVRVRLLGEGGVKLFLSATTLMFLMTLLVALTKSARSISVNWDEALAIVTLFTLSTAFYKNNSTYIRTVGVALSIFSSIVYAVSVSLLISLLVNSGDPLIISTLVNFIAVLLGCDVLSIKWVTLTNTRSFIIGGMGVYDAVVLIPTASYLISALVLGVLSC